MKYMKKSLVLIVSAIILCVVVANPLIVHASEIVAVGTGSTFESALHNAMRIAIERSIGTFVSSRTLTVNQQLITDEIMVKSGGYIESYDVLRQEQYAGIFEVEAKFKVRSEELRSSVMTLLEKKALVEANLSDPRIAVIAIDDSNVRYPEIESEVTNALHNAGFSRITTAENAFDYAVKINVQTSLNRNKTYSAILSVKMIAANTNEIVYANSFRGRSRMFTNNSVEGALEFASKRAASAIATAALNRAASLEQHVTIRASRTTVENYGGVENLKARIREISGVRNIFVRSINRNDNTSKYLELDVNFDGSAAELASLLANNGFLVQNMYSSVIQL